MAKEQIVNCLTGEINYEEFENISDVLTAAELEQQYKDRVVLLIREKYSADDEFAIIRKYSAGIDRTEFSEYHTYAENCKALVKAELGI